MTSKIPHVSLFFIIVVFKVYKFVPPVFSGIQICEPCVYFKEKFNILVQGDKFGLLYL